MTRVKRKLEVLQEEEIDDDIELGGGFESYKQPPSKKPSTSSTKLFEPIKKAIANKISHDGYFGNNNNNNKSSKSKSTQKNKFAVVKKKEKKNN